MHRYTSVSAAFSLTAATAKTAMQLVTPATRRAIITAFKISFRSVTASNESVLIEILPQTDAGTTPETVTPRPIDDADPAALCTVNIGFDGEPTSGTGFKSRFSLTPVGGTIVYHIPVLEQFKMLVSARMGLRLTAPQNQSNVIVEMTHQE